MFTGIIQAVGKIDAINHNSEDARFIFATGILDLSDLKIGDSVAVNGTCLTIIEKSNNSFVADLSRETLNLTTFSELKEGRKVNLEKAMQLSDRINGHLLSGHVDGIAKILDKYDEGESIRYAIQIPEELIFYVSKKGSIAIDGVSLTVNEIKKNICEVNIIPHTLSETIFSEYEKGTEVNVEVDLLARYLNQLIQKSNV